MRTWIAAVILLAALAVAGLAALPHAVDWDARRPRIEAAAEAITGQSVTIAGPVEVALLPRPALIVKDVLMDGEAGARLEARRVEMGLRLGPLLTGRLAIDDLKLTRPVLTLARAASDQLRAWPPEIGAWADPFVLPGVTRIVVADGRLNLVDGETASSRPVTDINFELARAQPEGPLEMVGVFKTRRHRFSMTGRLGAMTKDGASSLKLEIEAQNGVEETTKATFNGVIDRRGDDQGLRGRFDLGGPDLREGLKAMAAALGRPLAFLSVAAGQPFTLQGRLRATPHAIVADRVNITIAGKQGNGRLDLRIDPVPELNLELDLPTVRLADRTALVDFLPLDVLSALPVVPREINIRARELIFRDRAIRRAEFKIVTRDGEPTRIERAAALLPGLMEVELTGALAAADIGKVLQARVTAVGDDLGATLHWLGLVPAERGDGWRSFSLESDLEVSSIAIVLSGIDLRLDSSRLRGEASLRFSERLKLGLDIDVDRLNLDRYRSTVQLAESLVDRLDEFDASIDARFQRLAWRGLRLEQVALKGQAIDRRLALTSLALRSAGETRMDMRGEINLSTRAVDLSAELSSRFPARALRHVDLDLPMLSTRLRPIDLTARVTGQLEDFELLAEGGYDGGRWSINGTAGWIDGKARYDLAIEASHPDHLALADQLGLAPLVPAGDAPGPFEVAGQLRHDDQGGWLVAGNGRLGTMTITGRITRQGPDPQADWDVKLSIGNPGQDSLAPFLTLAGFRSAGNWRPRSLLGRIPRTGIRTAWLDDVGNGRLTLTGKGGLAGEGVNLSAKLKNGFLFVDNVQASPWNGELRAEFSFERRRGLPYAALALELDDVDSRKFADWLGLSDVISGRLDLRMEVAAIGQTLYDMVAASSGELEIDVAEGRFSGTDIPDLRNRLTRSGDGVETTPGSVPVDDLLAMRFSGLKGRATLSRGIAELEDVSINLEPMAAAGRLDGTIDLLLWIADLTLSVEPPVARAAPVSLRMVGPPNRPQTRFRRP